MSFQLFGLPVSRGVAIGRAVLAASSRLDVAHYFVDASALDAEVARLRTAREVVIGELSALQRALPNDAPTEIAALLDVHLMLLHDENLAGAIKQWIVERHYNAEWALSAQLEVLARQFDEMEDEYLRERKADIEQVVERLLRAMARAPSTGFRFPSSDAGPSDDGLLVLVANDIAPADMLQFKGSVFAGFVTDLGGSTSHTAIVARSMDIPAVVGAREASRLVRQDDWLIVDGDAGVLIVNPTASVLEEYRARQSERRLQYERLARLRNTPARTADGQSVELLANIELPGDAPAALQAGAVGVGLFRTEFLFLNRGGELPGEDEQFEAYRCVVQGMGGLPVTIRTVDVGADKPLERMSLSELRHEHTLNPALGLRAIRWSLAEPRMFRRQLRAILRASAYGPVRILIPMVAHLAQVHQTLQALEDAKRQLADAGQPFGPVAVGAMVEIPAAVLMLPALLRELDFVSVGTNDLIQYTLAIDRSDDAVAHLYDPWHPAVLRLLATTIAEAGRAGKPVSVCGEMAGETPFTELMLAMGLRSFSMHASRIPAVKERILECDTRRLAPHLQAVLEAADPQEALRRALSGSPAAAGQVQGAGPIESFRI